MNRADAEEYTQALGQVVAGSWRQIALGKRLGVPATLDLSVTEWVEQRLGGYVRLSIPERREAVTELVNGDGLNQRETAEVLGVDQATVSRDLASDADASAEDPQPTPRAGVEPVNDAAASPPESQPDPEALRRRYEELPDDLRRRVGPKGYSLEEAEHVVVQRRERLLVWVNEIKRALGVITRLSGHPIPEDLAAELTSEEREQLLVLTGGAR